jgi:signal peptidase II
MERSNDSSAVDRRPQVRLFATALTIVVADQVVKRVVASAMRLGQSIDFLGTVVRFTRTENTGAAFGMLRGRSLWFIIISAAASVAIIALRRRIATLRPRDQVAFGLVLGGAVGNLIDRIRVGAVVDFIDIGFGNLRWPAFNIADSAITIGVILLAFGLVFAPRTEPGGASTPGRDGRTVSPDQDHR